jgi:hypothetical protein
MASFDINTASIEDRYVALSQWWQRHCKLFSLWYLSLNETQQKELILKYCPDIPLTSKFARETNGEKLQATDKILPELSLEGMLASQGKIMILFFTRRLTSSNLCMQDDLVMLNHLLHTKQLPSFSNHAFDNLNTPFIDPLDPEENICALPAKPEKKVLEAVWEKLKNGELIHAEVWLALKLRRQAIVSILEGMILNYEEITQATNSSEPSTSTATTPPTPSYHKLLQGELAQQALLKAEQEQEQAVVTSSA